MSKGKDRKEAAFRANRIRQIQVMLRYLAKDMAREAVELPPGRMSETLELEAAALRGMHERIADTPL